MGSLREYVALKNHENYKRSKWSGKKLLIFIKLLLKKMEERKFRR